MGCSLLGFLVCRLGVMVVSAGEEEKCVCVCVCACGLVTQSNEISLS